MGDIARHRNIFLNTREALPPLLLDRAGVKREDLTYLEMGNFLTDVSQFRDPVWYILAKRTIWQEHVLDKTSDVTTPARAIIAAAGGVGALIAGATGHRGVATGGAAARGGGGPAHTPPQLAGLLGLDDWLDKMLGVPFKGPKGSRRTHAQFGYVGEFFRHFTDGVTQFIFSNGAADRQVGAWTTITPLSETEVDDIYRRFFTQYYPHEHTDQPPYVWDASRRPGVKKWYGTSRRQQTIASEAGIMTAVDDGYIPYLADALTKLEADWRAFKPSESEPRRTGLIRLGKILHGVEDWFFHSNVVELNRLVAHRPARQPTETDEAFLRRFVKEALVAEEAYLKGDDAHRTPPPTLEERRIEFKRRLYRRLRFPVYEPATRAASGGTPSKSKASAPSLKLAYPAFPSQQDTAHTLLGALENLEGKFHRDENQPRRTHPPGIECALQRFITETPGGRALYRERARARGIDVPDHVQTEADMLRIINSTDRDKAELVAMDVLREWMPLVLTLLYESERDRLAANVPAADWPLAPGAVAAEQEKGIEVELQGERHAKALTPTRQHDGTVESNYRLGMRLLRECGMIGARSRAALDRAFDIDWESEQLDKRAPGAGGILIKFATKLHIERMENEKQIDAFNKKSQIYVDVTDSGANDEIVGSHSLMSKDTVDASPFFNDAHVMACTASQAVAHIFLDEVSSPASGTVLDWLKILRYLIRFPEDKPGWERRALALFKEKGTVPRFADFPEFAALAKGARLPPEAAARRHDETVKRGVDASSLEEEYIRLEQVVQNYRE